MRFEIDPRWRWVLVPIAAVGAGLVSACLVKAASSYFSAAWIGARLGPSGHLAWHLIAAPGLESALLGWSFVCAGRWMAPSAKAGTAAVLSGLLVGSFALLTVAVWLLEPTAMFANLQATVGCLAACAGARLALGREPEEMLTPPGVKPRAGR